MRQIARIFSECTGKYYVCADSLPSLDVRGRGYDTKADAMRTAYRNGYTHGVGSGTYRRGATLRSQVAMSSEDHYAHHMNVQDGTHSGRCLNSGRCPTRAEARAIEEAQHSLEAERLNALRMDHARIERTPTGAAEHTTETTERQAP